MRTRVSSHQKLLKLILIKDYAIFYCTRHLDYYLVNDALTCLKLVTAFLTGRKV